MTSYILMIYEGRDRKQESVEKKKVKVIESERNEYVSVIYARTVYDIVGTENS